MTAPVVARFVRAHLYGAIVIGTFIVLPTIELRQFDASFAQALPRALRYLGMALIPIGATLSYASFWVCITRGRGTAFPTEPPKVMMILGPYRFVRNPMYVGNLLMMFGGAFFFLSPTLLLYAVVMCVVVHLYVTASEEPLLKQRYGAAYLAYVGTTPRWFPKRMIQGGTARS
jgi:protein-S-isoprenylcysteine O-methyltransferase Ste14